MLEAYGIASVDDGYVVLAADSLPADEFAFTVLSPNAGTPVLIGLGQVTLCVGSPFYRWHESLAMTSPSGEYQTPIAMDSIPIPGGTIAANSTWTFQVVHRDSGGSAAGANSTNAFTLTF